MTREQAEFLAKVADNEGIELRVRSEYSGRCMYGNSTYAVIVRSEGEILAAAFNLVLQDDHFRSIAPRMDNFHVDSMGRDDVVVY